MTSCLVGPTIQEALFSVLVTFRKHGYDIIADITNMYIDRSQMLVHETQCDYQRIVWRNEPNKPVTYGTSSPAYLGISCLIQTAIVLEKDFPEVSSIIKTDFNVNDLLSGSSTMEVDNKLKHGHLEQIWIRITNGSQTMSEY